MNCHPSDTIFVSLLLACLMIFATATPIPPEQGDQPQQSETTQNRFSILIKKGERKLYLYSPENRKERLARTFQISLGNNPAGVKSTQGDGATPEGDYYITHKNARSKFYLSLGVSYPNIADADKGFKGGLIT